MMLYARHRLRFYRRRCVPVRVLSGAFDFRLCDTEEFPWEAHPMTAHHPVYRERFVAGGRALIGSSDGDLVFTAWLQQHALHVDELGWTWRLRDTDSVVYDVVTFDAWRGRGIYPRALRELSGMLADAGVVHLWIYAEADNASSLRGIEKADFEFRGTIIARTIAGFTWRRGRVEGVNA